MSTAPTILSLKRWVSVRRNDAWFSSRIEYKYSTHKCGCIVHGQWIVLNERFWSVIWVDEAQIAIILVCIYISKKYIYIFSTNPNMFLSACWRKCAIISSTCKCRCRLELKVEWYRRCEADCCFYCTIGKGLVLLSDHCFDPSLLYSVWCIVCFFVFPLY